MKIRSYLLALGLSIFAQVHDANGEQSQFRLQQPSSTIRGETNGYQFEQYVGIPLTDSYYPKAIQWLDNSIIVYQGFDRAKQRSTVVLFDLDSEQYTNIPDVSLSCINPRQSIFKVSSAVPPGPYIWARPDNLFSHKEHVEIDLIEDSVAERELSIDRHNLDMNCVPNHITKPPLNVGTVFARIPDGSGWVYEIDDYERNVSTFVLVGNDGTQQAGFEVPGSDSNVQYLGAVRVAPWDGALLINDVRYGSGGYAPIDRSERAQIIINGYADIIRTIESEPGMFFTIGDQKVLLMPSELRKRLTGCTRVWTGNGSGQFQEYCIPYTPLTTTVLPVRDGYVIVGRGSDENAPESLLPTIHFISTAALERQEMPVAVFKGLVSQVSFAVSPDGCRMAFAARPSESIAVDPSSHLTVVELCAP